ncbi:MAG: T9SS type A sorting domain-containing protein [Ignavibacterium sp.]|nr:T9SS type A sorting domain-containing protein [Ignavibacterium sp.]
MKSLKIFIFTVLFISVSSEIFPQSFYFTYSGPTSVVVPYNSNVATATYYFTYYNPGNITLIRPRLTIEFDGTTIAGAICEGNNIYLPGAYSFSLTPGTHTIKLTLSDLGQQSNDCTEANIWQEVEFQVIAYFKVRNENIFGGGSIYVDNYTSTKTSPYDRTAYASFSYAIGAIDQDYGGYHWVWNSSGINNSKWLREPKNSGAIDYSFNRNTTYTVQANDKDTKLIAGLRKIVKPNFQNSFVSLGNGGVITVNNIQYNSPTSTFDVVELNPITAQAIGGLILNAIYYSFDHWSDGSTSAYKTFNPGSTTTYTAYYKGKPSRYDLNLGYNLNLHTSTVVGEPITLYWNEHPNTSVTKYQIWRKEKYNGVTSDPHLLATVNRGTTSFTDDDFNYTTIKNQYMLYYDVRPYYIVENSYADALWMPVFAEYPFYKTTDSTLILSSGYDNFISNYPNPFNPITNISYSIKDAGLVNIKVFDLLGQQVAELVNEEKEAGYYSITFDASKLPSGIYLYTINSRSFIQTRKMLLIK